MKKKIIPFSLLKKKLHKLISSVKTTKKPNRKQMAEKVAENQKSSRKNIKKLNIYKLSFLKKINFEMCSMCVKMCSVKKNF